MPSDHPLVVALRGDDAYAQYLDRLLVALAARGPAFNSRHRLAEWALAELGRRLGVEPPRRIPPHGGPRRKAKVLRNEQVHRPSNEET